jgi:hypothetical protein
MEIVRFTMKKRETVFYYLVLISILVSVFPTNKIVKGKTVNVNPDSNPPVIKPGNNLTFEKGSSGNYISWILEDDNPGNYQLYRDEILFSSAPAWGDGQNLSFNVDLLSVGIHNYTLVAIDVYENTATSTIWVTVIESEKTSFFWISGIVSMVIPFIFKRRRK